MINEYVESLLLFEDESLMIDAANVATVRTENTLLHAMMVLSNVGYSAIPVLDNQQKLQGIVTMPSILNGIKDRLNYNWEELSSKKVGDVLCDDCSVLDETCELEDILRALVKHNFACVVAEDQTFKGIITRKTILKRVNFMAHEFDRYYEVHMKDNYLSFIS